jgi:hypothetical protein
MRMAGRCGIIWIDEGVVNWYAGKRKEASPMNQYVDISISVPEEVLLSLRVDGNEFATQMKMLTALKLCEHHKLSIGQSAAFAGMDELAFMKALGQNKVSIFGSASDIGEDYRNA